MIRAAKLEDAKQIAHIYNYYILNTLVTFEETEVSGEEMALRILAVNEMELPWLVALEGELVAGYAYATKWKGRAAYRFSVESTVYLDPHYQGKGLGKSLYSALFNELHKKGVHAVMGGISLPNQASIALHEKFGMEKVAHFKQVGFKFGEWVDVGYWQRVLNNDAE